MTEVELTGHLHYVDTTKFNGGLNVRPGWMLISPKAGFPPVEAGMSQGEADYLQAMATDKRVLEVGSAFGGSTVSMALTAKEVIAVDPHEWIPGSDEVLHANLAAYGLTKKVTVIKDWSFTVLPEMIANGEQFDLVFIDGDHRTAAVTQDAMNARQLAKLLIFHDYGNAEIEVAPVLDIAFPAAEFRRELHGALLTVWL